MKELIFISSVQKELAVERRALKNYIQGDALLGQFFEVYLFEDMPASDHRADEIYLAEVDRCDVYLGLLGNEYGYEDADGVSPTEREFDQATAANKERLIFVKGETDSARHPKMQALVRKAGGQLIRRRFVETADLIHAVYASLVGHLRRKGTIQSRPFDEQPCPGATLDDIDGNALTIFVRLAHAERRFPLAEQTPAADVLAHLHMLADGQPTRAAVLLFGHRPQKFMSSAEIRCMHFHGTEIQRPAPYYQIFKGTLFEQVDRALDFVLSTINRSVGTRDLSVQAPATYEIPPNVVRDEAIVNAIAHRDYASAGAVQVSVFADRVEVWNPGTLSPPLTTEQLRHPHRSVARNAGVCEALFLARYIEKYGTGTLMMIRQSVAHALPEPDFGQHVGEFSVTIWRDWLTADVLAKMNLNTRQMAGIHALKVQREITTMAYQQLAECAKRTALRDLDDLSIKGVVRREGTGRKARYVLNTNRAIIVPIVPLPGAPDDRANIVPNVPNTPSPTGRIHSTTKKITKISRKKEKIGRISTTLPSTEPRSKSGPSRGKDEVQVEAKEAQVELPKWQMNILSACAQGEKSGRELLTAMGYRNRTGNFRKGLQRLIDERFIEYTIPSKPNSRLQKYRLTDKGRSLLSLR